MQLSTFFLSYKRHVDVQTANAHNEYSRDPHEECYLYTQRSMRIPEKKVSIEYFEFVIRNTIARREQGV